jgi:hypothetical protein
MQPETRIQRNLLAWWALAASGFKLDARHLAHIPNGGKRGQIEGAIFKAIGVRAGHEDLFLSVPRGTAHGLYLEVKTPDGRISDSQREMMRLHSEQGYAVTVAWSFDECVRAITNYLLRGDPLKSK